MNKIVFGSLNEEDVRSVTNSVELPNRQQKQQQQSKRDDQPKQKQRPSNNNKQKGEVRRESKQKNRKEEKEVPPKEKPKTQIFIERSETNAWSTPGEITSLLSGEQSVSVEVDAPQVEEKVQEEIIVKTESDTLQNTKRSKNKKKKQEVMLEDNNIPVNTSAKVNITPRGLKNVRNSCYMNAALQALLYVPAFYSLFKHLHSMNLNREKYKLTRALAHFVSEFPELKSEVKVGTAFAPQGVLDYMKNVNTNILKQGDQHDTHEFLLFLLQSLQAELQVNVDNKNRVEYEEDGWVEIGKNNKSSTVQEIKHEGSPISQIFSGKMRMLLKKRNVQGSLTLQPFYSLHLPIDSNTTDLAQALRRITLKEQMDNASIECAIEQVPKVLIIQLNRFKFDMDGSKKITKHISFPERLHLDKTVIPTSKIPQKDKSRDFELVSVVCHHGDAPTGGHYSTFVSHPGKHPFLETAKQGVWIHFDDSKVNVVQLADVLRAQAYLLIYKNSSL